MNALLSIFSNPWMLVWLPVAVAPVLIHLWNRRQHRETSWAAMEYLLAAIEKNSRRVRIEQLLLLLIRATVVIIAVVALAKPFIGSMRARLVGNERRHQVFVIDASYSMQYSPADRSLFEIAKEQVAQRVDESGQGDGFSLVLLADPPRVVVGKATFDKSAFRDEIAALSAGDGDADLPRTLAAVENMLKEVGRDQPQLASHEVTFYSDLQHTTWKVAVEERESANTVRQQFAKLREQGPVEVIALGAAGADNLAVSRLAISEPFATVRQPVSVQAVLQNFGSENKAGQLIELLVDGRRVDKRLIDVSAGEASAPIQFQHQFETPGDHVIEVIAAGDSLAVDNRRYLSIPVKSYLNALLVSGKRGAAEPTAFSLETDFKFDSRLIKPEVVAESALTELDLDRFDCIFLFNIAQFTKAEANLLEAYLRNGGGVIFFLGDQVIAERYNELLAGGLPGGVDILPAKLQPAEQAEPLAFDPLEYRHPLLGAWKDQPDTGLLVARTWKYFPLQPRKAETDSAREPTRIALGFSNGQPAIVEAAVHRGRVMVVATAASPESVIDRESGKVWSNLFRAELITPLAQELWRLAVGSQQQERNVAVGAAFGGPLPEEARGGAVEVTPPHESEQQAFPRQAQVDPSRWEYETTARSGIYQVSFAGRPAPELFAVNVNTIEGNLARIDPLELPEELSRMNATEQDGTVATVGGAQSAPAIMLFKWLLGCLLVLLMTESVYAWWLGNRAW